MRRVNFRQFLDRATTTSHFQSPRLTDGAPSVVFADHLADCRERPVPAVEYRRNIHHQGAAKGPSPLTGIERDCSMSTG
jgi:hypothetical protein